MCSRDEPEPTSDNPTSNAPTTRCIATLLGELRPTPMFGLTVPMLARVSSVSSIGTALSRYGGLENGGLSGA